MINNNSDCFDYLVEYNLQQTYTIVFNYFNYLSELQEGVCGSLSDRKRRRKKRSLEDISDYSDLYDDDDYHDIEDFEDDWEPDHVLLSPCEPEGAETCTTYGDKHVCRCKDGWTGGNCGEHDENIRIICNNA